MGRFILCLLSICIKIKYVAYAHVHIIIFLYNRFHYIASY